MRDRFPILLLLILVLPAPGLADGGSLELSLAEVPAADAATALRTIAGISDFDLVDGGIVVRGSAEELELVRELVEMIDTEEGPSSISVAADDSLIQRFELQCATPPELWKELRRTVSPRRAAIGSFGVVARDSRENILEMGAVLERLERACEGAERANGAGNR